MNGPEILVRTLTKPTSGSTKPFQHGNSWQYHSRSDRHSKVVCWGVVFDLLQACPPLLQHAKEGKVAIGINHELRDFRNGKTKNLDLVLCRTVNASASGASKTGAKRARDFAGLADVYGIELSPDERTKLASLPKLPIAGVTNVMLALEAKAAMTAFVKARPRLKDELTSSFETIHGDNDGAIAAGLVIINAAETFVSPGMNPFNLATTDPVVSKHVQPKHAELVVAGLRELQRRSKPGDTGFDALGVVMVDCKNDGVAPVTHVTTTPPALPATDDFHYERFVQRLAHLYALRYSSAF